MTDPGFSATGVHANVESAQQIEKMSEVHNFNSSELDNLKILHQSTKNEGSLKAFRELRTLVFTRSLNKNFVCLVTSVCPRGGASYVASNLAASVALDKSKSAILVDCNFYSPSLDSLLSTEAHLGLTDYLAVEEMGIEFVLYASGIRRLRIIPAGKNVDGAAERLSSSKMKTFIRELKQRYPERSVIIDGPSVGDYSADIRLLSQLCDFVILVTPYGKASGSNLLLSTETIGEERMAGVVFNSV